VCVSVGRLHDLLNNSPTAAWTVTTTAAPQITSKRFVRASIVVPVDAIFAQEGASCCTALGDLAAYISSVSRLDGPLHAKTSVLAAVQRL
jgi:hypothetical protein